MNIPANDTQFETATIAEVQESEHAYELKRDDGWSFMISKPTPIVPEVGMAAKFYGKGIGYIVRGLMLDDTVVYYRNEADDEAYQKEQRYGKDARDMVAKWDAGGIIWSVECGGFGPGYEQALQIAMIEMLRVMVRDKINLAVEYAQGTKVVEDGLGNRLATLGLSGMQWGAAMSLATRLYRDGPIKVIGDCPDDRRIQISKHFPSLPDYEEPNALV